MKTLRHIWQFILAHTVPAHIRARRLNERINEAYTELVIGYEARSMYNQWLSLRKPGKRRP